MIQLTVKSHQMLVLVDWALLGAGTSLHVVFALSVLGLQILGLDLPVLDQWMVVLRRKVLILPVLPVSALAPDLSRPRGCSVLVHGVGRSGLKLGLSR